MPVANLALVPVGPDGTISIFNSVGQVNVVADVEGWVGAGQAAASGQTTTMTPARILDTRTTTGGHHAPLGSGQSLTVAVAGTGADPGPAFRRSTPTSSPSRSATRPAT